MGKKRDNWKRIKTEDFIQKQLDLRSLEEKKSLKKLEEDESFEFYGDQGKNLLLKFVRKGKNDLWLYKSIK